VLSQGQRRELTAFNVTGVPNRVTHANMTATPKLTASFMLDGSGIVKLLRADAHIEVCVRTVCRRARLTHTRTHRCTDRRARHAQGSQATHTAVEEAQERDCAETR
jgi:hypothetical protein